MHSEKIRAKHGYSVAEKPDESLRKRIGLLMPCFWTTYNSLLEKKDHAEEFFHTFNSLFEYKKQVVLTSDKYPKEISGLEERIKSRLVWGMNVMIDPPDLETRMAILHKKAENANSEIPDDVAYFLAKNIYSNVRELEGSLRRLIATSGFKKRRDNARIHKRNLKDLVSLQKDLYC